MTMGERIKQLREQMGLTQEELGKYIGVQKSAIRKYEKNEVENMKRSSIEILSKLFNVSPSYLMCLDETRVDELGNPVVSIPLLGVVKAGYNYLAEENYIGTVEVDKKIADSGKCFALKVHGDSMSPVLIENDIVIIRKQDDFENGDIVVALVNGDEKKKKKGIKRNTGITLKPLNSNYDPLVFTYNEMDSIPVTIVGIVKQLKREF